MMLVYAFALNQVKPVERDDLCRESTAQENKADELKKGAGKIADEHAEEDIEEHADTLGGTVQYDPHLINHTGKDLIYERYALNDLDKDGIPELILLSDHSSSMNAIFTYTDRLIYCGTYYNALYTDDGKIIERGSWWAGSAMIIDPWYITEIKAGRIVTEESVWGEYLDHEESEIRYMQHTGEEAEEISYEEYRDIKNALLCSADFVRNMPSKELRNLQQELLSGNFEHLSAEYSDYRELFEMDWERGESEWRQIDLNGDGVEDFILQEAKPIGDTGQKRITGIFAIEEDSIRCIMSDLNDYSEYFFCGPTGKLMYTASNYGGVVDNEPYDCYHYDNEWQEIIDYRLEILRVDSEMDEDYAKEWKSENPDMAEDGLYYFRYIRDEEEKLMKEEWTSIYEAETGLKFDGSDLL